MEPPITVLLIILGAIAVGLLVVAIVLIIRLLRLLSAVRSGAMPLKGKVAFWTALIYGISPVDLMPAPIYLDDIVVLASAIAYVGKLAQQHGIGHREGPLKFTGPRQRAPERINGAELTRSKRRVSG